MKRSLLDDFRIDGARILAPDQGVEINFSDLEADSARDESGILHRVVARHGVRSWKFTYGTLTVEEYQYILNLLKGKSTFAFEITNSEGELETVQCYCSKKSASYYSKRQNLYKSMTLEILEC